MFTKEYLEEEYLNKNRSLSQLASEHSISPKLMYYYVKKFGLTHKKGRRKYSVDVSKFKMTNPVFCYYVGLVITDGYVDLKNHRVSVRVKNEGSKEVLEALKDYFSFTGEVRMYRGCNDLTITSDELIASLKRMSITGKNKTYEQKFPKFMSTNEDCQRMFIRGIIDGDGNIHTQVSKYTNKICGGQFRIVEGSTDFIKGLISFINKKFGFNYEMSNAKMHGDMYPKLEMKVEDSLKLYKWVYEGYPIFRFSDKYERYCSIIKSR